MENVNLGQISPEEADDHPQSHMLTRCLGLTRFVNVDRIDIGLEPGDRIMLCSDGLNSMVPADGIAKALADGTADEAAWKLVEAANKAGGHDNISVIVIDAVH
jgi:protein phosphatase